MDNKKGNTTPGDEQIHSSSADHQSSRSKVLNMEIESKSTQFPALGGLQDNAYDRRFKAYRSLSNDLGIEPREQDVACSSQHSHDSAIDSTTGSNTLTIADRISHRKSNARDTQDHILSLSPENYEYRQQLQRLLDTTPLDKTLGDGFTSRCATKSPPSPATLWTPPWLRKSSLLGFFCLFTALWVALIVVWRYDIDNSGFFISPTANRFSWTYSPTAVLVAITGLWRQVDYHSKINQPWQQLAKGPSSASSSVLLDYISPNLPMGLLKAFRNGHWTVAATMTGFTVLKLITVFSTALLAPVPTTATGPVPVQIVSTFDGTDFWRSTAWGLTKRGDYMFINVSPSAAVSYLQLLQGKTLAPNGTQKGIVFQEVRVPTPPPNITKINAVSTVVDSVVPSVSCRQVPIKVLYQQEENIKQFSGMIEMDIPGCGTAKVWLSRCKSFTSGCENLLTKRNLYRVYCSKSGVSTEAPIYKDPSTEMYLILLTSEIRHQPVSSIQNAGHDYTATVSNIAATSCKVTHTLERKNATLEVNKLGKEVSFAQIPDNRRMLNRLTDWRLTELLYSVLVAADGGLHMPRLNDSENTSYTWSNDSTGYATLFKMIEYTTDEPTIDLFDSEVMTRSAVTVFTQLAGLFIHEKFSTPTATTVFATSIYTRNRLRFSELSLWVMVASFLILSMLALSIIFTFNPAAPQDPSLLGSQAAILAQNPALEPLLDPLGGSRTSHISRELNEYTFTTEVVYSSFRLHAIRDIPNDDHHDHKPDLKQENWVPIPARVYLVVATFMVPLLGILVLEILYRQIDKTHGFAMQDTTLTLYATQYGSTLAVLIIASLFNGLDFTIVTFATFSVMRSRAVPSFRGLTVNPMREMTPVALLRAVRHGNVGLFSSNLTVIIGSVLTIVISNLWIQEAATAYIDIKAPVSNTWNSQWDDNAFDDGGASTVLNNVQPNGVGSPDTATWNDIVIPSFGKVKAFNDTQSIFKSRTSDQAFDFILNVSALRPRLFCDVQTSQVSLPKPESDITSFTANAEFPVPSECGTGIQQGQRSTISFSGVGDNSTQWAGFLLDLHMGYNMTKTCPPCTTSPIVTLPDRFKGCPYVGVLFGKPTDGISALLCTQTIQQVEVNLRFQSAIGPNGVFDLRRSKLTSSPVINESLTTNLTGSDTRMEAFSYRVQSHFDKNLTIGSPDDQADPFFQYIISRSSTANITELSQDRNFLVATVNKVYSDYMVQVIHSPIFRRPADSAHEGVVNGTISRETTLLFMNHNAKIILQVSLGSMVVFGLTAFLLVDLKGTLPRSPHSIASVMALFAGSELCSSTIMEGSEWMDKRGLDRLFEGYLFSLGWWSRSVIENESPSTDTERALSQNQDRFGIDIGTPERLGFKAKGA